jgi:penicillin amidase
MPGQDSSYMWQGFIPQAENPHALNPTLGFLHSANQRAADATYPYFIPGSYITARGITIHNMLNNMSSITPEDMMKLQNNYFNTTAEDLRPIILTYLNEQQLNANEKEYLSLFKNWDLMASPDSKGQTIFRECINNLYEAIWDDEYAAIKPKPAKPNEQTLLELLKKDTSFRFIDNINTPNKETIYDIITTAFQKAATALSIKEKEGKLVWSKYNNPSVYHLIKDLKPFAKQGLYVGGDNNIVNAIKGSHGPSWRMVVQLSNTIEAYGVYPGGQSGNPGSKFYDNFVDGWAAGKYNKLWYMQEADKSDKNVKWVMKFNK